MYKVDLRQYPRFWNDFDNRVSLLLTEDNSLGIKMATVRANLETWLYKWYGIRVRCKHSGFIGEVYMVEPEYLSFVLKWS